MCKEGNPNSLSDSGVAGVMAIAGARGAIMNVNINLNSIDDKTYIRNTKYILTKNKKLINTISIEHNKFLKKLL